MPAATVALFDQVARARKGVALSAATVAAPVAGEFDAAVYEDVLPKVAVSTSPSGV